MMFTWMQLPNETRWRRILPIAGHFQRERHGEKGEFMHTSISHMLHRFAVFRGHRNVHGRSLRAGFYTNLDALNLIYGFVDLSGARPLNAFERNLISWRRVKI